MATKRCPSSPAKVALLRILNLTEHSTTSSTAMHTLSTLVPVLATISIFASVVATISTSTIYHTTKSTTTITVPRSHKDVSEVKFRRSSISHGNDPPVVIVTTWVQPAVTSIKIVTTHVTPKNHVSSKLPLMQHGRYLQATDPAVTSQFD